MRGRAMLRPLIKGQVASMVLALAEPLTHTPFTVIVTDAGTILSWGSITGLAVLVMWNLLHPDREPRMVSRRHVRLRPEEELEFRANLARALASGAVTPAYADLLELHRAGWDPSGRHSERFRESYPGRTWQDAVREAQRAGTFSLNGVRQPGTTLRYQGPPPVYTPPGGIEVVITVELRAGAQVGGQGNRVSSNACMECGELMDVAWVKPGTVRLCRPCRAHGTDGYVPYIMRRLY